MKSSTILCLRDAPHKGLRSGLEGGHTSSAQKYRKLPANHLGVPGVQELVLRPWGQRSPQGRQGLAQEGVDTEKLVSSVHPLRDGQESLSGPEARRDSYGYRDDPRERWRCIFVFATDILHNFRLCCSVCSFHGTLEPLPPKHKAILKAKTVYINCLNEQKGGEERRCHATMFLHGHTTSTISLFSTSSCPVTLITHRLTSINSPPILIRSMYKIILTIRKYKWTCLWRKLLLLLDQTASTFTLDVSNFLTSMPIVSVFLTITFLLWRI